MTSHAVLLLLWWWWRCPGVGPGQYDAVDCNVLSPKKRAPTTRFATSSRDTKVWQGREGGGGGQGWKGGELGWGQGFWLRYAPWVLHPFESVISVRAAELVAKGGKGVSWAPCDSCYAQV